MQNGLFDLSGKIAIVTGAGANGGIGHAIAVGFARHGADIVAADIDETGAQATATEIEQLGRRAAPLACDISRAEQVAALFAAVDRAFGRVDILVNVPVCLPQPGPSRLS